MNNDIDILNGTDDFPFPQSINNTDFKQFDVSQIDKFLYENHRFTSLEILIKDLKNLSTTLNQTLLDLVNNDYSNFIKLGKSINGSEQLIHSIIDDLKEFNSVIIKYQDKFVSNSNQLSEILRKREQIIELKTYSKLTLLLNDQIIQFDQCLDEKNLRKLTGLYLSIINTSQFLLNSPRSNILQNLQSKVSSIKLEFPSYLKQLMKSSNNDTVVEVLNIYRLIGLKSIDV